MERNMKSEPILKIKDLKKYFSMGKEGIFSRKSMMIKAVDGINFFLNKGQTFGLVGESGCGKSTTGRSILKLYEVTDGEILFQGKNIHSFAGKEKMQYRRDVQAVFQDPYGSLNPRMRIGEFIEEPMLVHGIFNSRDRKKRVAKLLGVVGLSSDHASRYPHEFSGGQRQRICIARALSLNPKLVILDEPVSALDVSIRAQVLNLLMDLQEEFGLTYLFISHDLSVIRHLCNRIAVMYLGTICELAPTKELFESPRHPYTQALLSAIPKLGRQKANHIKLKGEVPTPINLPSGCIFHGRCLYTNERCINEIPRLIRMDSGTKVACHGVEEGRL